MTLEKKILPPLLPDSNPRPFNHECGAVTTELSLLSTLHCIVFHCFIIAVQCGKMSFNVSTRQAANRITTHFGHWSIQTVNTGSRAWTAGAVHTRDEQELWHTSSIIIGARTKTNDAGAPARSAVRLATGDRIHCQISAVSCRRQKLADSSWIDGQDSWD